MRDSASERKLALVRFLSARQAELRGLHTAAFGVWLFGLMMVCAFVPLPRAGGLKLLFFILNGIVPPLAQNRIAAWYEMRFGRVEPRGFLRPFVPWLVTPSVAAIAVASGTDVDLSSYLRAYAAGAVWLFVSGVADHGLLVSQLRPRKTTEPWPD